MMVYSLGPILSGWMGALDGGCYDDDDDDDDDDAE